MRRKLPEIPALTAADRDCWRRVTESERRGPRISFTRLLATLETLKAEGRPLYEAITAKPLTP